jgi:hypothetical protein
MSYAQFMRQVWYVVVDSVLSHIGYSIVSVILWYFSTAVICRCIKEMPKNIVIS